MLQCDEQWLALADKFYNAAIDSRGWGFALEGLAAATGSRSGELITVGRDAAVPINLITNFDPVALDEFAAVGGGDPAINPRVNAGMHAPVLKVLAESDFMTPDEHARNSHYQEFARPWDIPFICLATLERHDDLLIGLAVLRSQREGHITAEQRGVFASLAPHVRAAVRMQLALEGNGAALVKGTLEALTVPAFVCDRLGRVQALTSQAEELVRGDRGLQLQHRRLRAQRDTDDKTLDDAIALAARGLTMPQRPLSQTVIVRSADDARTPLVLDVMSLPSAVLEFSAAPRVVVVARGSRGNDASRAVILQGVYGFTSAETDIALQLAQGKSTEAIAQERDVAIGTVRAQIKSILAKLDVSRQAELVAKLSNF
jgi:DNA-binding CsgD family transcriptional regulator